MVYNLRKCHITAVDARRSQFLDLCVTQCVMARQIFCFSQFSSPLEISAEINEELVYIVHHIVGVEWLEEGTPRGTLMISASLPPLPPNIN